MVKILKLDNSLIDKIAAGEVIVRPASVVKELVENSIDAGATRIRIEISNATRDITVIDDGCGIEESDFYTAFERHATSKIKEFDDLEELQTRGFRGEALASIASVSKLEMKSRLHNAISGMRIEIEGGKIISMEPAGCPAGTTFHIRSLFFNTPARLKFLKSEMSEMNLITQTLTSQALSSPQIGFTLVNKNTIVFELPSGQTLKDRILQVLGSGFKEAMLEINKESSPISIYGFTSKPANTAKDRRLQYFFVDKRPIEAKTLNYCVEQAYSGLLMTRRFPVCVIFIELGSGEVDVNVHPTKTEVRFRDERLVSSLVYHAVRDSLQKAALIPEIKLPEPVQGESEEPSAAKDEFDEIADSKQTKSTIDTMRTYSPHDFKSDLFKNPDMITKKQFEKSDDYRAKNFGSFPNSNYTPLPGRKQPDISGSALRQTIHQPPLPADFSLNTIKSVDSPESILENLWTDDSITIDPLGQLDNTYILASIDNNLLLIDQHAAHERINYNKFSDKFRKETIPSQNLLLPLSFDVKIADIPVITDIIPVLGQFGFQIVPFGGATYSIESLPVDISESDAVPLIEEIIDDLKNQKDKTGLDDMRDRIIVRASCRASVKSGQELTTEEMKSILRNLKKTRLPFTCPHGRPTMILLTRKNLDKQFKRIVN